MTQMFNKFRKTLKLAEVEFGDCGRVQTHDPFNLNKFTGRRKKLANLS
jgi:hypothetical protein